MKRGIISGLALLAALFILGAVSAPATRAEPSTHVPPPCLQNVYLPLLLKNSAGGAAVTAEQPAQLLSPATDHSRQPDFNGDGCADLAIGVPREDVGSVTDAGMVNVIYGGSQGLTAAHNQGWHRGGGYDVDGAYLGEATSRASWKIILISAMCLPRAISTTMATAIWLWAPWLH
jgi:hypothetical protein